MRGSPTHGALWRDPWIAAALLAALALRLAMARGGLWLDEAWSAVMAHDVGTPLGVLTSINHDNNHPLNSWWLQLVGLAAPPLLARAPAIACSVATLFPAAAFAGRRDRRSGQFAAWLFALSPMLVLLGSEARGYAPMLLAAILLIDQVDPRLEQPPSRLSLGLIGLLGALGHLLMLPAILLVALWLCGVLGWRLGLYRVAPALIAALAVTALLLGAALHAQGHLTIGSSTPFSWTGLAGALAELARLSVGVAPLVAIPAALLLVAPRPARSEVMLCLLLALAMPVAAALLHPANSHISRYFLLSTPALLWLVALRAPVVLARPRLAALLVGALLVAMAATDLRLIITARGEPDLPVRRIVADQPAPAALLVGTSRLSAVVTVAAAEQRALVTPVGPGCTPARFLLIDLEDRPPPAIITHCATGWSLLDDRLRPYRDGAGWALYRRAASPDDPLNIRPGLPAPGPVASGPRPAL